MEAAGSLGDLGTLLPILIGMVSINGINAAAALLTIGVFYVAVGAYFNIPVPAQPFKAIGAISIASGISGETISAAALIMAFFLLLIGGAGMITPIASMFKKPVIRGIQLGLGLTLIIKGLSFIIDKKMFFGGANSAMAGALNVNLIIGAAGMLAGALLINNKKAPAAIFLVGAGIIVGLSLGGFSASSLKFGFHIPGAPTLPGIKTFAPALMLLAIPQLPLTIGNAVIGTRETAVDLFGEKRTGRVTLRALCVSMGVANIAFGLLGGMPCCHGAGGLAAHYRFGARTAVSNFIIGGIFILLAVLFGDSALSVFMLIPKSILGVLLAFAGFELSILIRDVKDRMSMIIVIATAGTALVTKNMGIAVVVGLVLERMFFMAGIDISNRI